MYPKKVLIFKKTTNLEAIYVYLAREELLSNARYNRYKKGNSYFPRYIVLEGKFNRVYYSCRLNNIGTNYSLNRKNATPTKVPILRLVTVIPSTKPKPLSAIKNSRRNLVLVDKLEKKSKKDDEDTDISSTKSTRNALYGTLRLRRG